MGLFGKAKENEAEALVYTTYDSFTADQVVAMLNSNGVPAYKKESGSGQYITIFSGSSKITDVKIFVPKELEEKAKELLESTGYNGDDLEIDEEELAKEAMEAGQKNK